MDRQKLGQIASSHARRLEGSVLIVAVSRVKRQAAFAFAGPTPCGAARTAVQGVLETMADFARTAPECHSREEASATLRRLLGRLGAEKEAELAGEVVRESRADGAIVFVLTSGQVSLGMHGSDVNQAFVLSVLPEAYDRLVMRTGN